MQAGRVGSLGPAAGWSASSSGTIGYTGKPEGLPLVYSLCPPLQ
jgi:hypothetical protein